MENPCTLEERNAGTEIVRRQVRCGTKCDNGKTCGAEYMYEVGGILDLVGLYFVLPLLHHQWPIFVWGLYIPGVK